MKFYRAGIDIGSTTVKLVLLDEQDNILLANTAVTMPTRRTHCEICWQRPKNLLAIANSA